MADVKKLVEESIGTYLIGRKILNHQVDASKQILLTESSKIVSLVISTTLFLIGLFILAIIVFLGSGFLIAQFLDNNLFIFIVPITLLTCFLIVLWSFKKKLFQSIMLRVVKDMMS